MTTRLHISIGPVQGFVAQSRRTRDLWGSSYLLAFLSAHAMRGTVSAGGRLILPAAEVVEQDRLYQWVSGRREGEPPRIGSLPNHFMVEVEGKASDVAHAGVQALNGAWEGVCRAVWSTLVQPASLAGEGTEDIWARQTGSFWEVTWIAGDAESTRGLLARRKHWRTHRPTEEPGDKCTVMHDLQELSGFIRARSSEQQDAFWQRVCDGRLGLLDLRDNERLCAVALVKRLFPKVAREAVGWDVDASHWPSTVYVGAVPWIRRAGSAVPQQAAAYACAVEQCVNDDVLPIRRPPFALDTQSAGGFPKLDANYLHREFVMSERRCPLVNNDAASGARDKLAERLQSIYDATDKQGRRLGPPPTFYALLLADGDRLGELAGSVGYEAVSKALGTFTGRAPEIINQHDGVAVYAGGDDVLAMLPAPSALCCAQALSDAYRSAFTDTGSRGDATLSAAVVFAQVRVPLAHVLGEAHRLLDAVAKDRNGRDSLAAAVLKPGGRYCEWVSAWTRRSPDGDAPAIALLDGLVGQLDIDTAEPGLSSALIYRIRDTLTRLCGWEQWQPGAWGAVPEDLDICAFLRAEIFHSLEVRMDDEAEVRARELTTGVRNLLAPARNSRDGNGGTAARSVGAVAPVTQAGVDALLLARFLIDSEQRESGQ